jgi:hypothetical protein
LYEKEHPLTEMFDVDKATNLPANWGFDDYIKSMK